MRMEIPLLNRTLHNYLVAFADDLVSIAHSARSSVTFWSNNSACILQLARDDAQRRKEAHCGITVSDSGAGKMHSHTQTNDE